MTDLEPQARVRAVLLAAFPLEETDSAPWSPPLVDHQRRKPAVLIGGIAASVALVVALALAIAAGTGSGNRGLSATQPSSPATTFRPGPLPGNPALVGTMWLLTQVTGTHGTVDLAADHPSAVSAGFSGAWLHLSPNGTLTAEDTVNTLGGHYTLSGDQLQVVAGGQTYVLYAGHENWRLLVMAAIRAISGGHNPVIARGTNNQLVLDCDGYTLTFKADGIAPETPTLPTPAGRSS